jgi:hypothetical protein
MPGSPPDPLVDLAIHLAVTIGAAALASVWTVCFLRWLRQHWSWAAPGMLLGPLLWSIDQNAAVFAAATALCATLTGARWHHDDLRLGYEHADRAPRPPHPYRRRPRAYAAPDGSRRALHHPRRPGRRARRP